MIYTGTDPYFCSGGSLAEIFASASSPRGVQRTIQVENENLFNIFIDFPKPVIAAVNGPGVGKHNFCAKVFVYGLWLTN